MSYGRRCNGILFAYHTMHELAHEIEKCCKSDDFSTEMSAMRRRNSTTLSQSEDPVNRGLEFRPDGISWGKFADGFPNLFINQVQDMAGEDVFFLASFDSPAVIFEQLSLIYSIPRYLARSFTLILPYFPTGTMERVDNEGQIATALSLARLISHTPLTSRGPSLLMIFDIHALQERFYFTENVIPRLKSAIPLLTSILKKLQANGTKLKIAFPDDGAYKRFHNMFPEYDTIVCAKVRDGANRIVRIKEGDPKDNHVVIVDDLVQSGGTLIECAKVLMQNGATEISGYVTHGVFPNESWKKFTHESYEKGTISVKFSNLWITDSIPHAREIGKHTPFRLLSLAPLIADYLMGFDLLL